MHRISRPLCPVLRPRCRGQCVCAWFPLLSSVHMVDLCTLRAVVTKASPIEDYTTYKYHISMAYGSQAWEVTKRFSDFDTLLQALGNNKYNGLPRLPAKTLLGSPQDEAAIAGRKEQLRIILHDLLGRPDTRTSHQVRQFLALDTHSGDMPMRSLLPEAIRTFEDPRFGVSGLCVAPHSSLLMVTHEDSTHLSRLGRVWSVVEPDELGAFHLWTEAGSAGWKRAYSSTYGIKVRSLAWEEISRQFFIGLEDGKIEVYGLEEGALKPAKKASLELHHKSPVTYLAASPRRLLSLGFDTAMRAIDMRSHELVCGGRLMKRLKHESDYLTCGHLDDLQDRAFIGTSGGDVFVLDISRNPPNFLHTLEMKGKPVTMLAASMDRLYIAHADCVTVVSLEPKGGEERIRNLSVHKSKHLSGDEASILSVTVAPERNWIFGGFSDGSVAIWSGRAEEALAVLGAHTNDVTQLTWLPCEPWGPALYTGGGDGKVTTWLFNGSDEDYVMWSPQDLFASDPNDPFSIQMLGAAAPISAASHGTAGTSGGDPFEPHFGQGNAGNSDPFAASGPRINPQALKSAEDSDSDNDIVRAFR